MAKHKVLPDIVSSSRLKRLPRNPTRLISVETRKAIDSDLRAAARNRRKSEANADQLRLP